MTPEKTRRLGSSAKGFVIKPYKVEELSAPLHKFGHVFCTFPIRVSRYEKSWSTEAEGTKEFREAHF